MIQRKPKKKKRISISSAKDKARLFQQEIAQRISDLTGMPWGKDELIASREMGQSGTDIRLVGPALELFPFSVECKRQETWSIPSWIEQARANQLPETQWVLFCRKNRGKTIAVLDADAFFDMVGRIIKIALEETE